MACNVGTHIKYRAIDENSNFFKMCQGNPKVAGIMPDLWGGEIKEWTKQDATFLKAHRACTLMYMEKTLLREVGTYFSNTAWDVLFFLLSENRRYKAHGNHDELIERAIVGGDLLTASDARRPVRSISAKEVQDFAVYLAQVNYDSLFEHLDVDRMELAEVYRSSDHEELLIDLFMSLRDFYLKTSFYGFAITTWFIH